MMVKRKATGTRGIVNSSKPEEETIAFPCFRCGICCSGYQVQMNLTETRELAGYLGLGWQEFIDSYLDPRWPGIDTRVLRQSAGRCIFLDQPADSVFGLCRIQEFKPTSCRAWTAGLDRRECRQGLSRYWNLSIGENGRLNGSPDDIGCFKTFTESLTQEEC